MNLKRSLDRISQLMSLFLTQVKADTAMGKTDINKVAETVLIPLFTEVYSYTDLKNLNYDASNYPGIDLGDETARVAFQITSTPDSEKIKKTLRKFTIYKLYKKYDKLIIYILTEKQKSYSGSGYEEIIQGKFAFDKDNDIWDYRDILREVANFQIDKTCKIESILEANFGEGRALTEWEVVDNVERILNEYTQLFVGREEESQKLDKFLSENSSGVMLVTAGAGFGKTALLANWVNAWRDKDCFIAYHFFTQRYRSVKSAYRNLLRQLYIYYKPAYEQISNDDEEHLKIRFYNLLREYGTGEGKPLIIVIDGLDEAEKTFSPPFSTPLQNVFVIASARAQEGEAHKYLEYWTDNSQQLNLNRLSGGAIAQWLRNTDELAAFAEDTYFIAQLDEITQGFPLYLRYLTEELSHAAKQGQDVREVLAQTPKGFERYVEQQLRRLDELELPDERWQFFALLAVAKGVLEKEDVKALTGMRDRQLRQLHLSWQVTRWMRISEGKFYAFAHPLLATTFAEKLEDEAEDALQDLIDYCARWQEHRSRYALRHYAEHLWDEKRWEELYAIARNEDFAATQQKQLPDEPDLSLKTVQTALLGAADTDNAGAMAEFLLVHARRLVQIAKQESPLDVLRSGSLERALRLADDFYEIERCVLWYLLLAWELKDTGRLEEAHAILKCLQEKELPRLPTRAAIHWQGDFAVYLLTYIFEISKDACTGLHQQLFNDDECSNLLCNILIGHGDFTTAIKTVTGISSELNQFFMLEEIAKAQVVKGQRSEARTTFAKALEITRKPVADSFWVCRMGSVAEAQTEVGDRQIAEATFTEALKTAQKIENQWQRVSTFIALSNMQAEARLFAEALDTLQKIDGQLELENSSKARVLNAIAEVEAKAGNRDKARGTFTNALKTARSIQDKNKQEDALLEIARAQAELRDFTDDALETAEGIDSQWNRGRALLEIVKERAQAEDFTVALAITSKIEEPESKAQALLVIAKAQAEARELAAALETAEAIDNQLWQTEALVAIVKAQAEMGDFPAALTSKNRIKDQRGQQNALSAIANAYAKAKNFPAALEIAEGFDNPLMQVRTLKLIAQAQAGASQTPAARDTFAKALQITQGAELAFLQALALANVAEVQVKVGQKAVGATTASIAYQIAQMIDNPKEQAIAIALIAEVLAKAGKRKEAEAIFDSAIETAQKIDSQQERVASLRVIAEAQARVEEFRSALDTAQRIEWPDQQAEVLAVVAKKQAKVGLGGEAHQTINSAFEIAQSYYYEWRSIGALCEVAVAQAAVGQKEKALELLTDLYEAVRETRERDKNLPTIAAAQAEVGEINTALKTTDEIEDEREGVKALSWIGYVQFKKGDKEGLFTTLANALQLKGKIKDEQKRVEALRAIASIQAMAGKGEEAVRTVKAVLTDGNWHLPRIASWLVETGDQANFKQLLIPCAYYLDAAYEMCRHLTRLYPEKVEEIAKVVAEFN